MDLLETGKLSAKLPNTSIEQNHTLNFDRIELLHSRHFLFISIKQDETIKYGH